MSTSAPAFQRFIERRGDRDAGRLAAQHLADIPAGRRTGDCTDQLKIFGRQHRLATALCPFQPVAPATITRIVIPSLHVEADALR